jgi:hypothetical protein
MMSVDDVDQKIIVLRIHISVRKLDFAVFMVELQRNAHPTL